MTIDVTHPTEEFLLSIDIHTLLPQQEPFVMIGTLTAFDEVRTATVTTIAPDNLFVCNGEFLTAGLVENIAQTCAARIGYYNKYILKKGIQIGVIAAVRNMTVEENPKVGDEILTTTEVVERVMGMILARATITRQGRVIATSGIKLAVRNEE